MNSLAGDRPSSRETADSTPRAVPIAYVNDYNYNRPQGVTAVLIAIYEIIKRLRPLADADLSIMAAGLDLPDGTTIEEGEVILFEGYPYRYLDADAGGFVLSPIHWGDSELDLRFESPADLRERWGPDSRGRMTEAEWRDWIDEARSDPRFGEEELDAVAAEVLPSGGLLDRIRGLF